MAEYIEREALREVVTNLRFGKHLNKDAALNLMERAIDNLPTADVVERKRGEWISVEERLPQPISTVLAVSARGTMEIGTYTEWGWVFPCYIEPVTHWMPLPEPPNCDMRGESDAVD